MQAYLQSWKLQREPECERAVRRAADRLTRQQLAEGLLALLAVCQARGTIVPPAFAEQECAARAEALAEAAFLVVKHWAQGALPCRYAYSCPNPAVHRVQVVSACYFRRSTTLSDDVIDGRLAHSMTVNQWRRERLRLHPPATHPLSPTNH